MLQLHTKVFVEFVALTRVDPRYEAEDLLNEVRSELDGPRLKTVHLRLTLVLARIDETVVQRLGNADQSPMERLQVESVLHANVCLLDQVADPIFEGGRSYLSIVVTT